MRMLLLRHWPRTTRTLGALHVDGKFFCYTLEDRLRPDGEKVDGETAIPPGVYRVVLVNSARFGPDTPSLENVPGFTHIRIHAGNTEADTRGCILVADSIKVTAWTLENSRVARDRLRGLIRAAIDRNEEVEIRVVNSLEGLPFREFAPGVSPDHAV